MSGIARPSQEILAVESLNVTFVTPRGRVRALQDVSLTMRHGESVALVGESGSGKTTLGLAISGFLGGQGLELHYGRLRFNGQDLTGRRRGALARHIPGLSMMFQDAMTSLDPVWTVGSQLGAAIRASRTVGRRDVDEAMRSWLDRVGLRDTKRVLTARPYELSGGMRQRVMLAIALCGRPELLIADEPTSALDAALSREAMDLMARLTRDLGTSLLIISHDIDLCREFSERTVVMQGGRILEEARSSEIATVARNPYTIGLLRCVPRLQSAMLDRLPTMESVGVAVAKAPSRSVAA
jgi:ABC-type dipeptide/oligopeptide/nickel transport system ATPase component